MYCYDPYSLNLCLFAGVNIMILLPAVDFIALDDEGNQGEAGIAPVDWGRGGWWGRGGLRPQDFFDGDEEEDYALDSEGDSDVEQDWDSEDNWDSQEDSGYDSMSTCC